MKRVLIVIAALLVVAVAAAYGFYRWKSGEVKTKRGSPTVQFTTTEAPGKETVKHPTKAAIDRTPWPMYGLDEARTHYAAPFHHKPPYKLRWTTNVRYYVEFPPTIAYGNVYVAQLHGRFFALNANTGKVEWEKRFDNCTAASPTIADGVVYQTYLPLPCSYGDRSKPGFIIAMNAKTGRALWHRSGPPTEASLMYVDGTLYYGGWDGKLYALDTKTRKLRWATQLDDKIDSSPAYHRGWIFIGTNGGSVYAVNAKTGRIEWRARSYSHFPNGREYFYATPTIAYGRVFIGNTDGTMYAFGERTGDLLWASHAGTYVYTAAAVWGRKVYVGTYDGSFIAYDAATGDVRWKKPTTGAVHGAPTVMDGIVYFSTCQNCGSHGSRYAKAGPRGTYGLDARTGKLVWSFPDGRYSPLVADQHRVYVVGTARVYGLDPCARRTASAAQRRRLRAC